MWAVLSGLCWSAGVLCTWKLNLSLNRQSTNRAHHTALLLEDQSVTRVKWVVYWIFSGFENTTVLHCGNTVLKEMLSIWKWKFESSVFPVRGIYSITYSRHNSVNCFQDLQWKPAYVLMIHAHTHNSVDVAVVVGSKTIVYYLEESPSVHRNLFAIWTLIQFVSLVADTVDTRLAWWFLQETSIIWSCIVYVTISRCR